MSLRWKAAVCVAGGAEGLDGNALLGTDAVGDEPEVAIGRNKGQDPLRLPALEADARMEADVIQQPWVLEGVPQCKCNLIKYQQFEPATALYPIPIS